MSRDPREECLRAMREIENERQARETGMDPKGYIRVVVTLRTEWMGLERIEAEQDSLLSTDCDNTDMLLVLLNRKVVDSVQMLLRESIGLLEERLEDGGESHEEDYPPHP